MTGGATTTGLATLDAAAFLFAAFSALVALTLGARGVGAGGGTRVEEERRVASEEGVEEEEEEEVEASWSREGEEDEVAREERRLVGRLAGGKTSFGSL